MKTKESLLVLQTVLILIIIFALALKFFPAFLLSLDHLRATKYFIIALIVLKVGADFIFSRFEWNKLVVACLGVVFFAWYLMLAESKTKGFVLDDKAVNECNAGDPRKCLEVARWEEKHGSYVKYIGHLNASCVLGNDDACIDSTADKQLDQNLQKMLLSKMCGRDSARACFLLSEIYIKEGNQNEAGNLMLRSCENKFADACLRISNLNLESDVIKSFDFLSKACDFDGYQYSEACKQKESFCVGRVAGFYKQEGKVKEQLQNICNTNCALKNGSFKTCEDIALYSLEIGDYDNAVKYYDILSKNYGWPGAGSAAIRLKNEGDYEKAYHYSQALCRQMNECHDYQYTCQDVIGMTGKAKMSEKDLLKFCEDVCFEGNPVACMGMLNYETSLVKKYSDEYTRNFIGEGLRNNKYYKKSVEFSNKIYGNEVKPAP